MKPLFEKKKIADLTIGEKLEIYQLAEPYYLNPKKIVFDELFANEDIYLAKYAKRIVAYFMVKFDLTDSDFSTVYLGLSCSSEEVRKIASYLYINFTTDAQNIESQIGRKLVLYGTTATPIVLYTLPKIWDNVRPDLYGNYKPNDYEIIMKIKKSKWGIKQISGAHPFVLKGVAEARYSDKEISRINQFSKTQNFTLFEELGIKESEGDRLLVLCSIPEGEKLEKLRAKVTF